MAEWRTYLGYLVSFTFVGGWWIAHSNLTRFIRSGSAAFFRLNLVALLFVSVMPFATSLMSTHSADEGARVATMVFGADILLASVALSLLGWYLSRRREMIDDTLAADDLRAFVRARWWVVGLLAVAVVVAAFSPRVAVVLYLVCTVLFVIARLIPRRTSVLAVHDEAGGDAEMSPDDEKAPDEDESPGMRHRP